MKPRIELQLAPLNTHHDVEEFLITEGDSLDPWDRQTLSEVIERAPGLNILLLTVDVPSEFSDAQASITVGHMAYQRFSDEVLLVNMVVRSYFRMRGCGLYMMEQLKNKGAAIRSIVNEGNLEALLFLKKQGFISEGLIRGQFDEYDGIEMVYHNNV